MSNPIVICPYLIDSEIENLRKNIAYSIPVDFWKDIGRIGSDLAYQYLWNKHKNKDVIILHADMMPITKDWYEILCKTANTYPKAGIISSLLLYPATNNNNEQYIQYAGGKFENGEAIHIGGGLDIYTKTANKELLVDNGSYNNIYSIPWATFGGIYLRREAIESVGNFDPRYYWTYYRDVDYCLELRKKGWDILINENIKITHFEGKDNKNLIKSNTILQEKININREIFFNKWKQEDLLNFKEQVNG